MDNKNLQICFLTLLDNRFYSEQEVALILPEMKQAVQIGKVDLLTMDGAVSIAYYDEELLGVQFWDVVNLIHAFPYKLLEGESTWSYLSYQTCWLRFHPQGQRLLYELESVAPSRPWHVKCSLPLHTFVRQWSLMSFRLTKFEAYLGSKNAQNFLTHWRDTELATEKWRRVVGEDKLDFIVEADLKDVLLKSQCNQGYRYSDSEGYSVVT